MKEKLMMRLIPNDTHTRGPFISPTPSERAESRGMLLSIGHASNVIYENYFKYVPYDSLTLNLHMNDLFVTHYFLISLSLTLFVLDHPSHTHISRALFFARRLE
jgi:hypothetical protein